MGAERIWLLVGGVAAVAAGWILAASEDESAALLSPMALSFGIAALAVCRLAWRTESRQSVANEVVRHRGSAMPALVFHLRRWRLLAVAIAGIAFAVTGGLLALLTWTSIIGAAIGIVGAVFFGRAGLSAAIALIRGGYVALTPDGIAWRGGASGSAFVGWAAIDACRLFRMGATAMLGLELTDRGAIEASWWTRLVAPLDRALVGHDLVCTLSGIDSPKMVATAIRYYLRHPRSRPRLGHEPPPTSALSAD